MGFNLGFKGLIFLDRSHLLCLPISFRRGYVNSRFTILHCSYVYTHVPVKGHHNIIETFAVCIDLVQKYILLSGLQQFCADLHAKLTLLIYDTEAYLSVTNNQVWKITSPSSVIRRENDFKRCIYLFICILKIIVCNC